MTECVTLGQNFGRKKVKQCELNLNTIWETWAVERKRTSCWYLLPFEHNAQRDRQTDRQTDRETDRQTNRQTNRQ